MLAWLLRRKSLTDATIICLQSVLMRQIFPSNRLVQENAGISEASHEKDTTPKASP